MPSHLHPRSMATSTLFAGTLIASFVVVAVPHIWPCPRPRKAYMDGEIVFDENGRAMRRVRRKKNADVSHQVEVGDTQLRNTTTSKKTMAEEAELLRSLQAEAAAMEQENARRECPVPKPRGAIGRWLGFQESADGKKVDSS